MLVDKMSSISLHGKRKLICLVLAVTTFISITITYVSIPRPHRDAMVRAIKHKAEQMRTQAPLSDEASDPSISHSLFEAASNRTLGLGEIVFLNLPHRHDRFDAMAIQAHLTGIKYTRFPAVDASQLKDIGMPPTENPTRLNAGEKGCWRAHANVWQHMLENQIPAVLVLESDAGFDVNLRPIMGRLNGGFRKLLKQEHPGTVFTEDPDDPWMARSGIWDLLSIGHCSDGRNKYDEYVIYNDPDAPHTGFSYGDIKEKLNRQRIVYRANNIVCTTGYLISLSGAARLLVRSSWNLDDAVDLIINMMTGAGELKAYSSQQKIVAQWGYIDGIKSGTNSDIRGGGGDEKKEKTKEEEEKTKQAWEKSKKNHNSYEVKGSYEDSHFVDFALGRAWEHIVGT